MTRLKRLCLTLTLLVFLATWVRPNWPYEQALHSSLTVLGLAALWLYARKNPIRDRNFALVCVFIAVHCIAARWLYSFVPYDAWIKTALGFSFQETLGWRRNHFDRLVHVVYGVCMMPALMEYFRTRYTQDVRRSFVLALSAVMVTGLLYEWFEWGVALVMAPEYAEAYNGQQGDMWDAHKDMLVAVLGALAWLPVCLRKAPSRAD